MTKRIVQVGNYSRVVELITVEFICQHCGQSQSYTSKGSKRAMKCKIVCVL